MVLNGYIDDSGSEPKAEVFVLAGYVLPAEKWAEFSDEWDKALSAGKRIPCLHMKDLGEHEKKSPFAGWDITEKESKLLALAAVIQKYNPVAIATHARWAEFQRFESQSALSNHIQNPYKALLHEITRIMYLAGQRQGNPSSVDFIFDEQGPIGYEATSWYRDMKEAFPSEARSFFGATPIFRDDEKVLPLQAADMFAWFYRRRLTKPVVRPAFLEMERMISEGFTVGSDIDVEGFETAARDFEKVAVIRSQGQR